MRFDGKTVLITGGASGIGAATAARFAAEGATVVVADRDESALRSIEQELGVVAITCDVTSRSDVEAAVATAVGQHGSLDVLVTCAGIIRDNLLFKMTDDDWDSVIDTHLKGTFLAVRAAQAPMVEQRSGAIVLISSTSALGNRGQTNYSTAKAGLQGMAKTLAIELGPLRRAGQLCGSRVHRDGHDPADGRADGRHLRAVRRVRREPDAAAAHR